MDVTRAWLQTGLAQARPGPPRSRISSQSRAEPRRMGYLAPTPRVVPRILPMGFANQHLPPASGRDG
ncbi:hypothetical protein HJFPF1_07679 [Paramyrothecium foliicola]|nr:hypothetical protein HJFPF1_07679 [Paramyrothecium foliicola]